MSRGNGEADSPPPQRGSDLPWISDAQSWAAAARVIAEHKRRLEASHRVSSSSQPLGSSTALLRADMERRILALEEAVAQLRAQPPWIGDNGPPEPIDAS